MAHDASSGADRSYAVLLSSLLALRSDPATDHFDALLSRLEATAHLDPALARELRWWQRESVRGVEDYVASTLPVLLSSVDRARVDAADAQAMADRSWQLAAPATDPVSPATQTTVAEPPPPVGPPTSLPAPTSTEATPLAHPAPPTAYLAPPSAFPAPSGLVAELPPPSPFTPGPPATTPPMPPPVPEAVDWQRNDRRKTDRRDIRGTNVIVAGSWTEPGAESPHNVEAVASASAAEVPESPTIRPPGRFLWTRPAAATDSASGDAASPERSAVQTPDAEVPEVSEAPLQEVPPQSPDVVDLRTTGVAAEDPQERPIPSPRRRLLVTGLTIVSDRPHQ